MENLTTCNINRPYSDMGTVLQFSKETLAGKWIPNSAFIMPATFMPSTILQSSDLTTLRTVAHYAELEWTVSGFEGSLIIPCYQLSI